jgi:hypothetical protein
MQKAARSDGVHTPPGYLVSQPGAGIVAEPVVSAISPVRQVNTSSLPSLLGLHWLLPLPVATLGGLHGRAAVVDRGHSLLLQLKLLNRCYRLLLSVESTKLIRLLGKSLEIGIIRPCQ